MDVMLALGMSMILFQGRTEERTCFQVAHPYDARIDIRSDVAIVYGINPSLPERLKGWREHGYITHLMTGVAWGGYQDYLYGRFDGEEHLDDAQMDREGNRISHGGDVYYMVPTKPFTEYLKTLLKVPLDLDVEAIHLEEPEFWVRGGYSEGFKREWREFYGTKWVDPESSEEAFYKASKLKQFLYYRSLSEIARFVRKYSTANKGERIRFYVPTHSLINYAAWRIVSPESKLLEISDLDGLIAQVWTGTARTPNLFRGVHRERTFETALMEYGYFANLVKGIGRKVWFLHDPVEDNPNRNWDDYRRNYEKTVAASLFYPRICGYEVMPWPWRVFQGVYPFRKVGDRWEKRRIPTHYATEVLTVINALNDMCQGDVGVDAALERGGVLVSDTMMFQKPDMSVFYGMVLPLLKNGVFAQPVPMENLKGNYADFDLMLVSYDFMKPPSKEAHEDLMRWLRDGGTLVLLDDLADPFNRIPEWWREEGYETPIHHLFAALRLGDVREGEFQVGKGRLIFRRINPREFAASEDGGTYLRDLIETLRGFKGRNWMKIRRGPYLVVVCFDETDWDKPLRIEGEFIDLFDPELPVMDSKAISPGEVAFLYDLSTVKGNTPRVLVSASRIRDERYGEGKLRFVSEGPEGTVARTRVYLPSEPKSVSMITPDGKGDVQSEWDKRSKTLLLTYENRPEGVEIRIVSVDRRN